MEPDFNSNHTITSPRSAPLADWPERSEETPRNLQVVWLTRRFGLSPTFVQLIAELAFNRRAAR